MLPVDRIDDFLLAAAVSGFEVLTPNEGRWPKVRHKDTDVTVDILPEGATPGTAERPAPTTIPHPQVLGASGAKLEYILLPALVELKLAAGRLRDDYDIVELIRANPEQVESIRHHLRGVHLAYAAKFDDLVIRAAQQEDR